MGKEYKHGYALPINQDGYRYNIEIGKICMLLCYEDSPFILFEIVENTYIIEICAYKIGRTESYECFSLAKMLYYKPLYVYKIDNALCISPSYGFVSGRV